MPHSRSGADWSLCRTRWAWCRARAPRSMGAPASKRANDGSEAALRCSVCRQERIRKQRRTAPAGSRSKAWPPASPRPPSRRTARRVAPGAPPGRMDRGPWGTVRTVERIFACRSVPYCADTVLCRCDFVCTVGRSRWWLGYVPAWRMRARTSPSCRRGAPSHSRGTRTREAPRTRRAYATAARASCAALEACRRGVRPHGSMRERVGRRAQLPQWMGRRLGARARKGGLRWHAQ